MGGPFEGVPTLWVPLWGFHTEAPKWGFPIGGSIWGCPQLRSYFGGSIWRHPHFGGLSLGIHLGVSPFEVPLWGFHLGVSPLWGFPI